MDIFKLKTIDEVLDSAGKNSGLKKTLGPLSLFLLGLGAIIGTGIFGMTGIAAVNMSGPAVTLSYALAGFTAIFIALTYTEIATMVPTAGGAYSYAYIAFGEIVAWLVSWMLILYFLTSSAAVASSWSGYMVSMLHEAGINLPIEFAKNPISGGIINLPASLIVLVVTMILVRGTKESAMINGALVVIKILAIGIFIYVAVPHFNPLNWFEHNHPFQSDLLLSSPFVPFGINGIVTGAAFVFFAYNGFDSIAAAAEEAKNPKRDLTVAILGSLLVCMILYMMVAALLVGIIPFNLIDIDSPIPSALSYNGHRIVSSIIAGGVVIGMISVIIAQLFALSRIVLVTSRDGLLPPFLSKVHAKFHTPYNSIISLGLVVSLLAGLIPLELIGSLSSVGALFSFMVVCLSMLVLRARYPDVKRPFRCPAAYLVSAIGVLLCLTLIASALNVVGIYIGIWVLSGIAFYFIYYTMRTKQ
ncbi:MAG: amino acid permease [Pseudomonadota bacterium]